MDSFNISDFNHRQDELIDPDVQGAVDLAISICKGIPFRNKQNKPENTDNYKVLSSDEIVQYVVDFVQEVNGIIQVNNYDVIATNLLLIEDHRVFVLLYGIISIVLCANQPKIEISLIRNSTFRLLF